MKKTPVFLHVLKALGFLFLALAIYGFVLIVRGFGDFATHDFMIGGILTTFGSFAAILCLLFGFAPQIARLHTKTALHIHTENQADLAALATTQAETTSEAIKTTAKAVREGLTDDILYCKHCGGKVDTDSKFCKHCGGAL